MHKASIHTAADGVYDFYTVAILQLVSGVLSAGNNIPINFCCQALACQTLHFDKLLKAAGLWDLDGFTIEDDVHNAR